MTKRQEHIRRWLAAAGPRIVAVAATAGSLGLVCTALAATVNTVTVADSAGAQRTVMAAVTEPEVLLDLAGMELESNDSTRLHEVEDGTLLLSGVSAEALCEDDAACEALDETGGADSAGVLSGMDADAPADSSAVCCCAS